MVDVGPVRLRVRRGGSEPAVAPRLVEAGYPVVVPDLRGYGQSGKVEVTDARHEREDRATGRRVTCRWPRRSPPSSITRLPT